MGFVFRKLELDGLLVIEPDKRADSRGFSSVTYARDAFLRHGVAIDWVQDNHSYSAAAGVLRGLHFQRPPFAQDKLVRVVAGAVLDVAVDIRRGSPTFGRWASLVLSAAKWNQLLVPRGFAHGFRVLEPATHVLYKVSQFYSPAHDAAIRYDDPAIGVDWQLGADRPLLSDRDAAAPLLADTDTGFVHGEAAP
ncbi:MAG: dTDP-4-dehydrorhamnose 3,5-epimerase [Alphaproteobacteria bacterium]|nr:MAG: dTDP-4-dehydrorhamnose 3,5-epimerase [Alphaproteobacteria bacterium]